MVTTIVPGLTAEHTHEGAILVLRVSSVHREVIDSVVNTVTAELEACHQAGRSILWVVDASENKLTMTPYIRAQILRLASLYPGVKGRTAFVTQSTLVTRLIMGLLRLMPNRNSRQRRIFVDFDTAMVWLEEALPAA